MFSALEQLPREEMEQRQEACRKLTRDTLPDCGGLLVFSRVNTYYLTGHSANGVFWLPLEGEPVLLCRKGEERARLESPLENIESFRSYSDLENILPELGAPLTKQMAVEMSGLSWGLSELLKKKLPGHDFVNGDMVILKSRSVKSAWELAKMRICGQRHDYCLQQELPKVIAPGMNEHQIATKAWEIFLANGHQGMLRMNNFGEEIFLGHVSAGNSANYPSVFNGPVGVRGEHPAVAQMGYAGQVWTEGQFLTCDIGFFLEGYQTDKTQVYFAGSRKELPEETSRAHEFCVRVQDFLASNLKPGSIPSKLYEQCMAMAEKEDFLHGFMGLGKNKVKFLGHGIGLAIDEYPVIARGFDEPLEEGMVLALEPKYGLENLGMVGVENTFEVTPEGGRCLTGGKYDILFSD